MPLHLTLAGKSALITGGASGIGRATARAFKALGANVIATGVSEQEVQAAGADPALAGIALRVLDVTDAGQVTRLFESLAGLDILVNAAGIAFLCSPLASFITGIIMPIDGGYVAS